jgi:hypothetical protein
MMAKQVRPWQVKPNSHRERKARQADKAPASEFHQGQRLVASIKSPDLWPQSLPAFHHRLKTWQNGGDHLCVKTQNRQKFRGAKTIQKWRSLNMRPPVKPIF